MDSIWDWICKRKYLSFVVSKCAGCFNLDPRLSFGGGLGSIIESSKTRGVAGGAASSVRFRSAPLQTDQSQSPQGPAKSASFDSQCSLMPEA